MGPENEIKTVEKPIRVKLATCCEVKVELNRSLCKRPIRFPGDKYWHMFKFDFRIDELEDEVAVLNIADQKTSDLVSQTDTESSVPFNIDSISNLACQNFGSELVKIT